MARLLFALLLCQSDSAMPVVRAVVCGSRLGARIPDDLPEVAVEVAKVARVDTHGGHARPRELAPRPRPQPAGRRRPPCSRQGVDAELARLWWPNGIPASFASSVRGYKARMRLSSRWKHRESPAGFLSSPTNSVAIRSGIEAEALAVEHERTLKISHRQREHMDAPIPLSLSVANARALLACSRARDRANATNVRTNILMVL